MATSSFLFGGLDRFYCYYKCSSVFDALNNDHYYCFDQQLNMLLDSLEQEQKNFDQQNDSSVDAAVCATKLQCAKMNIQKLVIECVEKNKESLLELALTTRNRIICTTVLQQQSFAASAAAAAGDSNNEKNKAVISPHNSSSSLLHMLPFEKIDYSCNLGKMLMLLVNIDENNNHDLINSKIELKDVVVTWNPRRRHLLSSNESAALDDDDDITMTTTLYLTPLELYLFNIYQNNIQKGDHNHHMKTLYNPLRYVCECFVKYGAKISDSTASLFSLWFPDEKETFEFLASCCCANHRKNITPQQDQSKDSIITNANNADIS